MLSFLLPECVSLYVKNELIKIYSYHDTISDIFEILHWLYSRRLYRNIHRRNDFRLHKGFVKATYHNFTFIQKWPKPNGGSAWYTPVFDASVLKYRLTNFSFICTRSTFVDSISFTFYVSEECFLHYPQSSG